MDELQRLRAERDRLREDKNRILELCLAVYEIAKHNRLDSLMPATTQAILYELSESKGERSPYPRISKLIEERDRLREVNRDLLAVSTDIWQMFNRMELKVEPGSLMGRLDAAIAFAKKS